MESRDFQSCMFFFVIQRSSRLPGLAANVESPTTDQGMVFGARTSRGEYQAGGLGVSRYPLVVGKIYHMFVICNAEISF